MITYNKAFAGLRLGIRAFAAAFGALLAAPALGREDTALDRYVAAPDPNYGYELVNRISGDGYAGYVLEMTSQQWRTATEVDRPIWKHWLTIVKPDQVKTRTGALVISGGSNESKPPTRVNPFLSGLAVATRSVVSEVRMVPNQPLTFAGETKKRSEDAIIAYTWDRYLRTGEDGWPLRLPMTKSAVRAMDMITAFCRSAAAGGIAVDKFVIGGGSKRGWTAWTTAAADKRVTAVVPVVSDMLNIGPSFEHHYRAYGSWASALHDYEGMGIMRRAGTPQFESLMAIEDPYAYRDRLTMPKFIVNSTGDQFFLPDSSRFYFDGLTGEKYLRYVPNTDHSLNGSDADESISAFYESVIRGTPRPNFVWRFEEDGSIRVKTETKPLEVKLWQATNPTARDFRFKTIGPAYRSSVLADEGDGVYVGRVARPERGWAAYFVEMTYPSGSRYPFKFTTGVRVAPDHLPFGTPQAEAMGKSDGSGGR
jgi:PhoPQ-activated pathogenicity-related protein